MSKDRIKETAVRHFNLYGYEGVRMAQIAEDAGIRKQSLSYHYPSKKELLLELFRETLDAEISFVQNYFASRTGAAWDELLHQFLIEHKNRFVNSPNTHFMFKISFFTVAEIHDSILAGFRSYLDSLRSEVTRVFAESGAARMTPEECTVAYMTLMDGLDVQLVYETVQLYEQALRIGWKSLLYGISTAQ
jgi:TetR/AcrR family transcriptional regulator, biofilm operon repressor